MAQNLELALWRTVLAIGLREPDAVEWQQSNNFEAVATLSGLDPDAVVDAFNTRQR